MMHKLKFGTLVLGAAALVATTGVARAALVPLPGKTTTLKDPKAPSVLPADTAKRNGKLLLKTAAGGPALVGNPITGGASLSLVTDAGSQCIPLPAGGQWTGSTAKGFKFKGAIGSNPTVVAQIKRSGSGVLQVKAVLKGKFGPLNDLLQANSLRTNFAIGGGNRYCGTFGTPANPNNNSNKLFKNTNQVAPGSCPASACAVCGDGVVDLGEACDSGGVDTAGCDSDCTLPSCGDGHTNAAAGEACDSSGVDTATCDGGDCTLAACGDGHTNAAAGEACDTSGVDTATCDGGDCSAVSCGDGYFNAAAGEACDSGGVDTAGCDGGDCTLPVCGDGHVNAAAGEVCDPNGSSFGSGPPANNGICDGCLSPSGAFVDGTSF